MMIFEFEETAVRNARMKVIGVGGAGGNAVNRNVRNPSSKILTVIPIFARLLHRHLTCLVKAYRFLIAGVLLKPLV